MKKSLLLMPITIALAIFFYPTASNPNSSGSPGGRTGSPVDGQNCAACHSGSINLGTGTAIITTNIPALGYTKDSTYTIILTGDKLACIKFGFELTAESGNNKSGDFMITDNTTKLVNNNNAVTHKASGTSGSSAKSWSMDWTPTSSSSGNTTFYAALMFANANSNNSGDNVFTTSLSVNEKIINPINDLPEKDNFTFNSLSKIITSNTIISVYDISGKLVLITKSNSTNISHLNTGFYILKSTKKSQKIILN
jgi:hypothetical protein